MNIVIVDNGTSNIASVANAIKLVGGTAVVTNESSVISNADKLILPGVGSFGTGYNALKEKQLEQPIIKHAQFDKKPLLGICLGMQYLATESEEGGSHKGLGLIPGNVRRLITDKPSCRVPNIGWCDLNFERSSELILDDYNEKSFYHVHSYYFDCTSPDHIVATIDFCGKRIPVIIQNGNIYGVQFHPEKSQDHGLDLLSQFIKL